MFASLNWSLFSSIISLLSAVCIQHLHTSHSRIFDYIHSFRLPEQMFQCSNFCRLLEPMFYVVLSKSILISSHFLTQQPKLLTCFDGYYKLNQHKVAHCWKAKVKWYKVFRMFYELKKYMKINLKINVCKCKSNFFILLIIRCYVLLGYSIKLQ